MSKEINKKIDFKPISDVILGSLLTEKSTNYELKENKVTFIINKSKKITKTIIKQKLSKFFGTPVTKVNTLITMKKTRQNRMNGHKIFGKTVRKAYVTFKDINPVVETLSKYSSQVMGGENEL